MPIPEKNSEPVTSAVGKPSTGASTWLFISRHQPALFLNGETIPLSSDREYIIGRDPETCSIVLNDERVSRKHAEIYARGGRYFIKDLGSSNGTRVNREKISTPIGLLPGDEIAVSTQKFLFVLHDQVLRSTAGPAASRQSHFSGLLRALRLPDLIQILNSTQQTGMLTIEDEDGHAGRAYLANGEITSAHYKDKSDEEAVYALVTIKDGHFEFLNENTSPPERTVRGRTMPLLLEA
jgi:pSer/pThr/pTyr-binding forkhead associated (FHA) protein